MIAIYIFIETRKRVKTMYKYQEIKEHFVEWMEEQDAEWLFDIIDAIKTYEQDNFGEVTTDLSDPEKLVNMYAYIVGEEVVNEWR